MSGRLSKTLFTTGVQCKRLLWWTVNEKDAEELVRDVVTQHRLAQGGRVGVLARTCVPAGVLVDVPHNDFARRISETAAHIAGGAPAIFEASFGADDVFVSVDILERAGKGWTLTEVKSTKGVEDIHVADAAVQTHVVRRAGLKVGRVEIMHLDGACAYPYPNVSSLFVRTDVTGRVEKFLPTVPATIADQIATLDLPAPPAVRVGKQCKKPHPCPFWDRCHPAQPHGHVTELCHGKAKAEKLIAQGCSSIANIPAGVPLTAVQKRQRTAAITGKPVVEPALASVIAALATPIAYLDFETVSPAVPAWPGCRPYDKVPVQFSYAIENGDGTIGESHWVAARGADPREELAEALVAATAGAGTILAYNARFERECIEHLAENVSRLAAQLRAIAARLVDLLKITRLYVYHPDFQGSFSLKAVLPAIVTDLSYDQLEIRDGGVASVRLADMLLSEEPLPPEKEAAMRAALIAYCRVDTVGMVEVMKWLRAQTGVP